ncbi:MAG: hypothetical protein JKY22_00210, partial [Flavobacteriaceae bacterium]|nr:hypothetical protein [Flavobacteriaceae bacterium]
VNNFEFDGQLKLQLATILSKSQIKYNNDDLASLMPTIKIQAKAFVARQLFGREGYYMAMNRGDNTIAAAMKALHQYEAILHGTATLVNKPFRASGGH